MKEDKWARMVSQDDNVMMMNEFLEKNEPKVLLINLTGAGLLQPATVFPTTLKNKAVYFVKR